MPAPLLPVPKKWKEKDSIEVDKTPSTEEKGSNEEADKTRGRGQSKRRPKPLKNPHGSKERSKERTDGSRTGPRTCKGNKSPEKHGQPSKSTKKKMSKEPTDGGPTSPDSKGSKEKKSAEKPNLSKEKNQKRSDRTKSPADRSVADSKKNRTTSTKGAAKTTERKEKSVEDEGKKKTEEFEEIQMACKSRLPVKYKTDHIAVQLKAMIAKNEKGSLLQAAAHVIRFRQTNTMESCYHLEVFNPTKEHILFRVQSPAVPYLTAKPKIGHLAPQEGCTVFLLFSFRCPRLPDDLVFAYSICQTKIREKHLPSLQKDKKDYTTRNARKLAKLSVFEHRWHVAVAFYAGEGEVYTCPGPHFEGNRPQLDNQGQIFEDNYNPDEHDDKSENLPSAAD